MAALKFTKTHNLVAFLSKPEESDGFEQIIQALVDGKKVIVTEASVRRDLQLADENGTECLPNATIFAKLERMGLRIPTTQGSREELYYTRPRALCSSVCLEDVETLFVWYKVRRVH
ncbi:hypothetical protein Tco_1462579 [Tanacetum coccineum]